MDLKTKIFENMKAAMKEKNQSRVAALRLIRDGIQKTEIAENQELDDAGVLAVLAKLAKQREESIEAYEKGGREDLAARERAELAIAREFMPQPLTALEITALVAKAVAESGAAGAADMGKVMKALKGSYEGRASGKDVSAEVKRQLG
jgi:hypothetical protein